MKKQFSALAQRRRKLLDRIEAQRLEVAGISQHWEKPLALVDAGLKAVRFIQKHHALLTGGVAALLVLRRKGLVGLTQEMKRFLHLSPALSLEMHTPGETHNTE